METKAREGLEYIQFFNSDREIVRVESLRGVFPEKDVVTQVVLLQEFEKLEAENKKLREALFSISSTNIFGDNVYDGAETMIAEARQALGEVGE